MVGNGQMVGLGPSVRVFYVDMSMDCAGGFDGVIASGFEFGQTSRSRSESGDQE